MTLPEILKAYREAVRFGDTPTAIKLRKMLETLAPVTKRDIPIERYAPAFAR